MGWGAQGAGRGVCILTTFFLFFFAGRLGSHTNVLTLFFSFFFAAAGGLAGEAIFSFL